MAKELGIDPADTEGASRVAVGDKVLEDQVIARVDHGVFGGGVVELRSPVEGVVEFISNAYGRMLIRERQKEAQPPFVVNAAQKLDIPAWRLRWHTAVKEGDEVKQGQMLAADPYSVYASAVFSPVAGVVEKICSHTGEIHVRRPYRPVLLDAYIPGRVVEVIPEFGARIATTCGFIQGVFGLGFEAYGRLRVAVDSPEAVLDAAAITAHDRGSVLVGGSLVTLAALRRAIELQVAAIIVGGANNGDLVQVLGREIGVGITGQEELGLTLIMTEGFGRQPMARPAFDLLAQNAGRAVSVNGTTQIRAGAIRPEVIIPLDER